MTDERATPHPSTVTRRAALAGAGALGLAALGACGSGGGTAGTPTSPAASGTVSALDQRGRRVTLSRPATRIVTVPMPAASLVVAIDGGVDHLVGMHQASWTAMRDGVLGEFFPQVLGVAHDIATADFTPNVESVVALRPDVVAQWGDQGTGLTAPLENAGLAVVGLRYGRQEDLDTWVTLFATLLGQEERGREIRSTMAASLAAVRADQPTTSGPAPKVLYFNRFAEGLKVAAKGTYNDFCIRLVGGTNPAADPGGVAAAGMVGVDVEQVVAWDPDIVLLGNFDAAMPEDVYRAPAWQSLSAVRSRRVYKVPLGGYRWDPPSHESPLMWRWLGQVVRAGEAPADLRAEVDRYYRLYYGHTPTDAQLKAILWSEANAQSAHYQRFGTS
jgi:iron complex transport system substrate-binding protein